MLSFIKDSMYIIHDQSKSIIQAQSSLPSNLPEHLWEAQNLTRYEDFLFQVFDSLSPFSQSDLFQLNKAIGLFFSKKVENQIKRINCVLDMMQPFFNGSKYVDQLKGVKAEFESKKSLPEIMNHCYIKANDLCPQIESLSVLNATKLKLLLLNQTDDFSLFMLSHIKGALYFRT